MNVVDSSGWLEYFADGPHARRFLPALQETESLVVPVVCIYEVFKVVLRERGRDEALQAAAAMQRATVVDVTPTLALAAAEINSALGLPMAVAMILATAQVHGATVWTLDSDFKRVPNVRYFPPK